MQASAGPSDGLSSFVTAAIGAVAAYFHAADQDVKTQFALDLAFQAIEEIALEFEDFPAAQAGHVQMIALWTTLIEVLLPFQVHEIEFVHQPVPLEKLERAVNRDPINGRI